MLDTMCTQVYRLIERQWYISSHKSNTVLSVFCYEVATIGFAYLQSVIIDAGIVSKSQS